MTAGIVATNALIGGGKRQSGRKQEKRQTDDRKKPRAPHPQAKGDNHLVFFPHNLLLACVHITLMRTKQRISLIKIHTSPEKFYVHDFKAFPRSYSSWHGAG
ncbi:MAG: hypothetical protein LBU11_06895 [Zoogloeaceae bacterium]|nr:hypothetical protein [Zoogloeaceae bacterium]